MTDKPALLWDLPTRIVHWALAICIVLNLFILEQGEDPHQWVGYCAITLVLFRFIWGKFAPGPANFRAFPLSFSSLLKFAKNKFKDDPTAHRHNPMASWVYMLIWFAVIALGITGWMMGLDAFWGDEQLENIHSNISTFVEILIVAHLVGMTADGLRHKRKTWLGMITGRRT